MALTLCSGRFATATTTARPTAPTAARAPRVSAVRVVAQSGERKNPYDDRSKTRKANAGGTKDANVVRQDKQDQYEYQQERLEWRRRNQGVDADLEGVDRMEPPHTNLAPEDSSERRGPDVEGSGHGHGDTLKELVDNVKDTLTGHKKHKDDGDSKQ